MSAAEGALPKLLKKPVLEADFFCGTSFFMKLLLKLFTAHSGENVQDEYIYKTVIHQQISNRS